MTRNILLGGLIVAALSPACFGETGFPEDTNKIQSITAEEAEDLVMVTKFIKKDDYLLLNGLTELTPEVAAKLALFKGTTISLNGLTSLEVNSVMELKSFKGFLSFMGLSSIHQQTAKALRECDSEGVYLQVPTVGAASAKELSKMNRRTVAFKTLHLYLNAINKDVAKGFKNIGCKLMLDVKGPVDTTTLAYLKSNDRIIVFSESKVL